MGLRAGEVLHRGAEAVGLHDPQVDLQPAGESHSGARVSLRGDLRHVPEFAESLDDGRRVDTADHDVQVSDGFLATPEAAGHVDLVDPAAGLQVLDDRPRVLLGFVQDNPLRTGCGTGSRDTLANLLEQLRTESTQLCDPALLQRVLEVRDAVHLQLVMKELHAFRAEAWDAQQIEQSGRDLADERLALGQRSRLDERSDLLRDAGADAR